MNRKKTILCVLLAMLAFVLVTGLFLPVATEQAAQISWLHREPIRVEYHPPQTHPEETLPPETVPPETVPPETAPSPEPAETEPAYQRNVYDSVPLYDQTAYGDIRYRSGTVATSGSNIVSLAMVASYLTGNEYLPDELASYFEDFIGNSMEWLEYASEELQLPWERAANIDVVIQALQEGKIAVVLMNERSIFMEAQHFVVFTGVAEDGRIRVNDPYGPNYDSWLLQNGLNNGFARGDLTGGYSGGWIYDPAAVPEQPFVYEPAPNNDAFRYEGLELTREDKELIARLICAEAESEPFAGQQGVAEVILNRLAADNFPGTVNDIIFAEGQFLGAKNLYLKEPTHTQYTAVERALYGPYVLEKDVVFFSQYAVNENVYTTIGKHVFCRQW